MSSEYICLNYILQMNSSLVFVQGESADVIIVGGGVVGLWTAYHLAQQGVNTLIFEQFSYPHTRGSSHGQTRITRTSYSDPEYAALMPEAFRRWKDLQNEAKKELYVNTGLLTVYDMNKFEKEFYSMLDNLSRLDVNHYVVPGSSLNHSFPGISFQSNHKGIFDSDSGLLMADRCTKALRDLITKNGVTLHESEPVLSIKSVNEKKVIVKTTKATYMSKSVILTCGAYINNLLSTVNLKIPVQPLRVELTYWKDKSPEKKYSALNQFPCTIVHEREPHYYTIPSHEYPGLMKISQHGGLPCDPYVRDQVSPDTAEKAKLVIEKMQENIRLHYPDIDASAPAVMEICMYSETPDQKFILDYHPKHKNIVIGSGFSGHGFKTSPSVGHILSNMALGLQPPYSLELFALKRFDTKSKL